MKYVFKKRDEINVCSHKSEGYVYVFYIDLLNPDKHKMTEFIYAIYTESFHPNIS